MGVTVTVLSDSDSDTRDRVQLHASGPASPTSPATRLPAEKTEGASMPRGSPSGQLRRRA